MKQQEIDHIPFWNHLTPQQMDLLHSRVRTVHYSSGQMIVSTDQDCLGILFILSGTVRIYLLSEDGREATIARLLPGDVCMLSASCMLSTDLFPAQVSAELDTEALLIPAQVFSQLMNENIYVENFAYRTMTARFVDVICAVQQMLFLSLEQRIVTLNIGSAREAVTRSLKQLASCGCIEVFRGGIRILNRSALYQKVLN